MEVFGYTIHNEDRESHASIPTMPHLRQDLEIATAIACGLEITGGIVIVDS
jgi:hypothetical protein